MIGAVDDGTSLLGRSDLERLLGDRHEGPHVSIYIPTHREAPEFRKDPIRLKNALREAADQLEPLGASAAAIDELLTPARELLADDLFWKHQGDGLAVLLAPGARHVYRLPLKVPETTVVDDRFNIKPLVPLLGASGRFRILAIGQNTVQLFEATRYTMREIDLLDIPRSLADALGYDWEQKSLQFRTFAGGDGAARPALYHGHGEGADENKKEIADFFRIVDRGICRLLADKEPPLVLAAVDYEIAIYRQVSEYSRLVERGIEGSPKSRKPAELHAAAWRLVEPLVIEQREEAASRYRALAGTGKASQQLEDVLPAAIDGRVGEVFVAVDAQVWGTYDPETRELHRHPSRQTGDRDLLEAVAAESLVRGADVYALPKSEVPGGGLLAAIHRY